MNDEVDIGAQRDEERKFGWPGRLAMTVGQVLVLLVYLLLLERYGFLLLDQGRDDSVVEHVIEAAAP
jgi:hypothetical protein